MRAILLFCLLSAFSALCPARATEPDVETEPYVEVERRLTAEQMRATGLDTLSPEQLALLNRLLRDTQGEMVAQDITTWAKDRTASLPSGAEAAARAWLAA